MGNVGGVCGGTRELSHQQDFDDDAMLMMDVEEDAKGSSPRNSKTDGEILSDIKKRLKDTLISSQHHSSNTESIQKKINKDGTLATNLVENKQINNPSTLQTKRVAVNGVTATRGDNNILGLANQDKQSIPISTGKPNNMKKNVNQQMQQTLSPKGDDEKELASNIGKPVLESQSSIRKLELQQVEGTKRNPEGTGPAEVLDLNGERSSFEKIYTRVSEEGVKLDKTVISASDSDEKLGEVVDSEEESQNVKLAKLHSLAKQLGIPIESIKLQPVDNSAKASTHLPRHLTKSERIIKIQSVFRMALAKKNYLLFQRRKFVHASATRIQATYRMHISKKELKLYKMEVRHELESRSAALIQSCFFDYMKRRATWKLTRRWRHFSWNASLKQKNECAVKLQSILRMFVIYRQNRDFLKKKKYIRCAKKLQSFYRMILAKGNYRNTKKAIVLLQSLYRRRLGTKQLQARLSALLVIQRILKQILKEWKSQHRRRHRSMLMHISNRKQATGISLLGEMSMGATVIQKRYKQRFTMKSIMALKIQRLFRGYSTRKVLPSKRRKFFYKVPYQQINDDCIILQKAWRKYRRRRFLILVSKNGRKVKKLQKLQAKFRSIKLTAKYNSLRSSSVKIQTAIRAFLGRRYYINSLLNIVNAQKIVRRHFVLTKFHRTLYLIVLCQSLVRMKKKPEYTLKYDADALFFKPIIVAIEK